MPGFTDQLGRFLYLPNPPRRIISLVPSQTELLYTLGLDDAVVGITKFCSHPASWFRQKAKVGGTKNIQPDRIHALRPDLIIANKEENDRELIEDLTREYPVWISDIKCLGDATEMIRMLGDLTGKAETAFSLANEIEWRFAMLSVKKSVRAAYFIWRNPWMVAGADTFINDMLRRCGYVNCFAQFDRYPTVELEALKELECDWVLLSSEPYPFRERHVQEIRKILPGVKIRLVDGELFSWYGSRLIDAPDYFRQLQLSAL